MFPEFFNNAIAVLLIRSITGILFFFQGYDKLFKVKITNVVRTFNDPLSKLHLHPIILRPAITLSSLVELLGGLFLFFGLFKNIVLFFLAGDLIFVAFIFSCMKPMWDMQYFFPRLIFIFLLLMISPAIDVFSLDYLFGNLVK